MTRKRMISLLMALVLLLVPSVAGYATHYSIDEIGSGWDCNQNSHAYVKAQAWYDAGEWHHKTISWTGPGGTQNVNETERSHPENGSSYTYAPDHFDENVSYSMSSNDLHKPLSWPGCIAD